MAFNILVRRGYRLHYILSILLFPFRIFKLLYYVLMAPFKKGDHLLLSIPVDFSSYEKSMVLEWLNDKDSHPLLLDFLKDLELIAKNPYIKRVSFFVKDIQFGLSELSNIADGIQEIKKSGKTIAGYCIGGELKSLYLMSFFDERYSMPNGEFYILLPSIETYFFGKLAKKLKVNVDPIASGAYKSYGETFHRDKFSDESRENLGQLIDSIREQIESKLTENTGIDVEILKTPILSAEKLLEIKFFHRLMDQEQFIELYLYKDYEKKDADAEEDFSEVTRGDLYFYRNKKKFSLFPKKKSYISIVPLKGDIISGDIDEEDLQSGVINPYPVIELLRELKEDDSVQAIVLEIDSGGGSAFSSELIHKEIKKLSNKKKVYAYFQNVAASGGYYIGSACDKIVSNSFCITGSIGSVMLRMDIKGLYNKIGVTKDRIRFYPLREIFSEYGKLSSESRDYLQMEVLRNRDLFYKRVMDSRPIKREDLDKLGEGRVFTGKVFHQNQMVDSNLSLMDTIASLSQELSLKSPVIRYESPVYNIKSFVKEANLTLSFLNPHRNKRFIQKKINDMSKIQFRWEYFDFL